MLYRGSTLAVQVLNMHNAPYHAMQKYFITHNAPE